ncbi:beta-lactamase/transpeptidase-like protein [Xylariaceae sp. AK1471]|nr:beta-lactamase/transpeptidase-like protein [Xylariaceae sp. AK1471]
MMYTVATHLVEVKTQQSFSDFLEERIFRPLSMESTSLQPARARARKHGHHIATGYSWDKNSSVYREIQSPDCPEAQGAGSIITSADDFIRWVKCLLRREKPIDEKVYQGLVRMRSFVNPSGRRLRRFTSPVVYAAGLEIYYYRGYTVVGHDGAIPGFGSRFLFLPDSKFGVVVMGNSDGVGTVSNAICRQLIDAVLQVPEPEPQPQSKLKKNKKASGATQGNIPLRQKPGSPKLAKSTAEGGKGGKKEENNHQSKHIQRPASQVAPRRPTQPSIKKAQAEKTPPPQEIPLTAYVGRYWHPGYHSMNLQIQDEKLFIDAIDRSMGFTLSFEHVRGQTKYTAYQCDMFDGDEDPIQAEFVLEDGHATKMGLDLEPVLKELIWFDIVRDAP